MQFHKFRLSIGEIELSEEDIRLIKPQIDKAFVGLEQDEYEKLKESKPDEIKMALENMDDDELLYIAKVNDQKKPDNRYRPDSFSQKIYRELFKRKGDLGYKQLNHLSTIQRKYLTSLGLKER
ncbi:hypothetical protein [Chryseobacterium oncorhynchi]|uniref:Uncharacterized protein n=1 Tax=Chryseobacterium oncorhynchi TaxID=741074 RepID=A0A316WF37_9FLAO|nr:hypothetical protein [Chryseobacterium oncorhynchi]PWN60031.1 hypothetical protein C1638_020915 [Chryseobacterium oncorhynchi]